MRVALSSACALAFASLGCAHAGGGGENLGEALAFAAAAGALQVAETAMEQQARNNAPVTHASAGMAVTPNCDNEGQYGCLSISATPDARDAPEPEMGDDDARRYVLDYVNGVRKLHAAGALVRDDSLDAFAQAASDELAQDHRPYQHLLAHARERSAPVAEVQGSPDGAAPDALQDQIAAILLAFTGEGPGGLQRDAILRPEWRRLGVGIAKRDGRMYFTVDFSS